MANVLELVSAEPDPESFPGRAKQVLDLARSFVVETDEDYKAAAEAMKRIARQRKFWDSLQRPAISKAKEAHTAAIAVFRSIDDQLAQAFDLVKGRAEAWMSRQLAEQKKQLEAAKIAMSEPVVAQQADERLAQAFDQAVASGDTAKAAHLLNQASMPTAMHPPPPPSPPPTSAFIPKVEGVSVPTNWTYDVIDEALVPREYLALDRKKISSVVKAMKGLTRIPGIAARPDLGMRVRA